MAILLAREGDEDRARDILSQSLNIAAELEHSSDSDDWLRQVLFTQARIGDFKDAIAPLDT